MKCSHADIQLHSKIKLVIIRCAMGQMLCQRRYSEKWRICPDLDCGTIWHEFKNSKPAVSAVSFPSATESLHIEHHLVYVCSESIGCLLCLIESKCIPRKVSILALIENCGCMAKHREHAQVGLTELSLTDHSGINATSYNKTFNRIHRPVSYNEDQPQRLDLC